MTRAPSNLAQIELAQLLAGKERNIFAVGDPDQAIYRFRGASSAAFAEFVKRIPRCKGVVLAENQRSLSPVLHCSYGVISQNPAVDCVAGASGERFERQPLESAREERARKAGDSIDSPRVDVVLCESSEQEAAEVARTIGK